jgi:hypothetical protein
VRPEIPPATHREGINHLLRKAMEALDVGRNREAVWGPSAEPRLVLEAIAVARELLGDAEHLASCLIKNEVLEGSNTFCSPPLCNRLAGHEGVHLGGDV